MSEKPYRLLLAEDETAIREPVIIFLKHLGYRVDSAENGIEALNQIRVKSYDLIVLDIKMPFIDGKQISQVLQDEDIKIPILVTTAVETNKKLYQEVGRLHKTYSLQALGDKVKEVLAVYYS
ncbi:response regulator [bacterium]|nr:response regulator [bacterium]